MSVLTENRPSPLQQSLESDHSTYSVSDYGDEDVAYYSDASTRSSDTFDHKDYMVAIDPLENAHKTRYEDNVGCIVHVRTDDELDDDTSGSDSDFEPTQRQHSPQQQQEQQERQQPTIDYNNGDSDSDSSVYSNESEYLDNESFHGDSMNQQTELQRTFSQETEYHDGFDSLDGNTPSATTSIPSKNLNAPSSSSSMDDSYDSISMVMDRTHSANTNTTTPTLDDEFDHKFDTAIAMDEDYSAVNLENSTHEQPSHLSTTNNRSTLRLSTVSASDLNEVSLLEDSTTTPTGDSTSSTTSNSSILQVATNAVTSMTSAVTKPSAKSPTTSTEDPTTAAYSPMSSSLPPLPPKDRSIKPAPIDPTAPLPPTPSTPTSTTTTPTMTPSRSSTTQRFVSGLWPPFKTSSSSTTTVSVNSTKKVVRPSANFTKRQSRPPSCALPGFQESLLAQMEQLNSDNGNDPKAQRLLNLKRQTIRQSLVLASSSSAAGGAEQNENDEYDWEFWTTVICDFDQVQNSKMLPCQVEKGVPPSLRGMVWQLLAKSQALDEHYIDLLRTSSPYEKMIQRDLARTFPTHTYFKDQGGVGQEGLYNVVRAYSLYDTEVGYCQGLAFVVGPLLLNMPDEEAFCVLIRLMSSYGLRGHFTPNMEGLHLRLYQFECLVADHLPHISRHLKHLGIDVTMYASQWFMTLFAYKFPMELVFRIYDMIFAQGLDAILRFALALFKGNETHLLELDFEHLLDFLKNGLFEKYKDDQHKLVQDANEWDIPRKRLIQLEKEHKAQLAKDEQGARLLTSLQEQQASLQHTVDQLTKSTASSQKEHQDVADQLQDSQHQRQQLYDEQASLKAVVDSLQIETTALPSKIEIKFKTEFDTLCSENARLNEKNAQLEDQLSATEALLIDIKMRYAQSEDERDDLSKRLFELKKVIAQ